MREYKHDLANAEELLCVSCLVRHPAPAFASAERGKVPYKHRCIGSTRKLHLYASHSITLEELRWQLQSLPGKIWRFYTCTCTPSEPVIWYYEDGQLCSSKQVDSTHTSLPVSGYWTRCVQYLDDIDAYVCPHMRTSNRQLQDGLRVGALEWRSTTTPDENTKVTKAACVYEHCETKVTLSVNERQVQVDITKEYGDLNLR
jgi:hypothetical protein